MADTDIAFNSDGASLRIKQALEKFIAEFKIDHWNMKAHCAFAARVLRREMIDYGLDEADAKELARLWFQMGQLHGLGSNASQFRQWAEEAGLLAKASKASNSYGI